MTVKVWRIAFEQEARRDFGKLDFQVQHQIQKYLRERLATEDDPKRFGKPLRHNLKDFWCYRVGTYRLICRIIADEVIVVVVEIGHRREVYD